MDYRSLRVSEHREVLRVVLDRPERNNSINGALLTELHDVLDRAELDPMLRIIALEATGPVFCAGMDFADAAQSNQGGDELALQGGQAFYDLLKRFTRTARIIVSLVDGRVTGGGVGIVAASDFVFATKDSTFGLPEALWGLLPACVLPFLIRRVGFQPAYAMTMSTLPMSATRAEQVHLVDEVHDSPEPALRRLASRVSKFDVSTIGDGKRYFELMRLPDEQVASAATDEFARLMSLPAVQERIANFASHQQMPWEKR